jgi:hypothetical protein
MPTSHDLGVEKNQDYTISNAKKSNQEGLLSPSQISPFLGQQNDSV